MAHNTRWTVWLSLALTAVGFAGGYALREGRLGFVLYHVGGLGAVAILACASAVIARRKGYDYMRIWTIALLLSVLLGLIAAYLVPPGAEEIRPAACGGSVSLGVGLILIAVTSFLGSKRGSKERAREGR